MRSFRKSRSGWLLRRQIFVTLAIVLAATVPALATISTTEEKPDPFKEGAVCDYPELVSWGSYVYQWPSKFDFVFEPFVSLIAECRSSGFISYTADFEQLDAQEIDRIGEFLTYHPWNPAFETSEGFQAKLDQMEAIYALRQMSLEEQAYLLRARAWLYGEAPEADNYRKKALEIHKRILAEDDPENWNLIVNLYVAGFYSWKLGDKSSAESYFGRMSSLVWVDEEGVEQTGSEYIEGLIQEIRQGLADDEIRFADPAR